MILMLNFIKTDQKLLYHTHTDDPMHTVIGNTDVGRRDAEVFGGTQWRVQRSKRDKAIKEKGSKHDTKLKGAKSNLKFG